MNAPANVIGASGARLAAVVVTGAGGLSEARTR